MWKSSIYVKSMSVIQFPAISWCLPLPLPLFTRGHTLRFKIYQHDPVTEQGDSIQVNLSFFHSNVLSKFKNIKNAIKGKKKREGKFYE